MKGKPGRNMAKLLMTGAAVGVAKGFGEALAVFCVDKAIADDAAPKPMANLFQGGAFCAQDFQGDSEKVPNS